MCTQQSRQAIQKTSAGQVLIVVGFVAYIVLVVVLFNDAFA